MPAVRVGFEDVMLEGSKKLRTVVSVKLSSGLDIRDKNIKRNFGHST